jgi:hypothetical protein
MMDRIARNIMVDIIPGRDETIYGGEHNGGFGGGLKFGARQSLNVTIKLEDADPNFVDKLLMYMRAQGGVFVDGPVAQDEPQRDQLPETTPLQLIEFTEDEDG